MKYIPLIAALVMATPAMSQEALKPVKLFTADAVNSLIARQFFGQVAARETVDLAFQVGGQVVTFPVVEGSIVPEGELIAQLDLEPFQLQLDQALLQKDQADRTLERLNKLSGSTVSQVSIDDASTQADLAEIAVRNAQRALDNATLSAPFDALVATRNVANFSTTAAGNPIVRLHDMSDLRIEIDVPEVLFQRAGDETDLSIVATFPASEQTFPLQIREFNAEASAVGQTFRISLGMTPPKDFQILPGSSATVTVRATTSEIEGIPVPTTAIRIMPDGSTAVMVFNPKGAAEGQLKLTAVEVTTGPDGNFFVTSGLETGSEIVAAGAAALTDGQNVRRFVGFSN